VPVKKSRKEGVQFRRTLKTGTVEWEARKKKNKGAENATKRIGGVEKRKETQSRALRRAGKRPGLPYAREASDWGKKGPENPSERKSKWFNHAQNSVTLVGEEGVSQDFKKERRTFRTPRVKSREEGRHPRFGNRQKSGNPVSFEKDI